MLAAWHENIAAYRQAHAEVLKPLQGELLSGQRQWVLALDAVLDQRSWSKAERDTLREQGIQEQVAAEQAQRDAKAARRRKSAAQQRREA